MQLGRLSRPGTGWKDMRMVKEAEQFKDQDDAARKVVEARNELERYAYSVKGTLDGELKEKFTDEETTKIKEAADATIAWLEEGHPDAAADEFEAKQKELEG